MGQKPQKEGYKGSQVKRLSKVTLDTLGKYDSNPDEAVRIMKEALNKPVIYTANSSGTIATQAHECTPCKFDETKLKTIIKTTMEEVMAPFTGG
jgi:hypothetical protein